MKHTAVNCLVQLANIEVCFSYEQWQKYKNNEVSLLQVALSNNVAFKIDTYKYKQYINFGISLAVAHFLLTIEANASTLSGLDSIDSLGATFVNLIQQAGYWICFAKGLIDIIKELLRGGDKVEGIGKILIKYVLAFSSFYLLPFFFDLIKGNFTI